jgi:hypothetical protein
MKRISVLSLAATLLLMMSCHPATEVKTSPASESGLRRTISV